MSDAMQAFGIQFSYNSHLVGEILDVGGLKFAFGTIDVTNHGSPGGYEENIASKIIRGQEFTIKCNSLVSNQGQADIKTYAKSQTAKPVVITFPDGYYISGNAIVTQYEVQGEIENQIVLQVTMKWTGAVTDGITASNNLSGLAVTTGTLYPAFAADIHDYVVTSTGNSCTVTATFAAGTAKLYKEGVYVQDLITATPSGSINLGADGAMTNLSIAITETGKAPVTYDLKVANLAA